MHARPCIVAVLALCACNHTSTTASPSAPSTSSAALPGATPSSAPAAGSASSAAALGSASPSSSGAPLGSGPQPGPAAIALSSKPVALPGAKAPVFMDYVAADRVNRRVWVPVGDTGSVDVFDIDKASFSRVDGFKTAEREMRDRKRTVGPSAVSIGDGAVYIGNRASSEVCAVDPKALKLVKCIKLPTDTDGVAYVASAKEVWVTTPRDHSLTVLDAAKPQALKPKLVIKTEGDPEGYAVDDAHGRFFTNLENKDQTLVIDVKTHKVVATYNPACGEAGPRGLVLDVARSFIIVACTDHLQVLDGAHDGAPLGKLDTGAGLDNLDYLEDKHLVYAAAGRAGRLTIARIDDKGQPSAVATGETGERARNAVADSAGNAYVPDARGAQLLVFAFNAQ